jgi:hypothetical protein
MPHLPSVCDSNSDLVIFGRAKHTEEAKKAKQDAKKGNYLLSHSLSNEFADKSVEEKRELVNLTLQKLRAAHFSNDPKVLL